MGNIKQSFPYLTIVSGTPNFSIKRSTSEEFSLEIKISPAFMLFRFYSYFLTKIFVRVCFIFRNHKTTNFTSLFDLNSCAIKIYWFISSVGYETVYCSTSAQVYISSYTNTRPFSTTIFIYISYKIRF